jgi:hypothetical protein
MRAGAELVGMAWAMGDGRWAMQKLQLDAAAHTGLDVFRDAHSQNAGFGVQPDSWPPAPGSLPHASNTDQSASLSPTAKKSGFSSDARVL